MTSQLPGAHWHALSTTVAGRAFVVQHRAGLATRGSTPAAILLSEYAAANPAARVMVFDVAYALPALLLPATSTIAIAERHAGMRQAGEKTLRGRAATWLPLGGTTFPSADSADLVLIEASATRDAWQRRLVQAYTALAVGGTLVAAAPNDAGGSQLAKDVKQLFGSCSERAKAHQRVVIAIKSAHKADMPEFAMRMGISSGTHTTCVHGTQTFVTLPGVFAHGRVDAGSAFLIEHLPTTGWRTVLDMGAGAGVLGQWALLHGASQVDMLDVDGGAAWCLTQTFGADPRVRSAWHDIHDPLPWEQQYDRVVVNPPFHSGRRQDETLFAAFVARAAAALRPRGEFWCVANAFLPYERVMSAQWSDVTAVATNGSYTVWRASGRAAPDGYAARTQRTDKAQRGQRDVEETIIHEDWD